MIGRRIAALALSTLCVVSAIPIHADGETTEPQATEPQSIEPQATEPWVAGPFEADPAALRSAAERATAGSGAPAIVLFDETIRSFEPDGRSTTRRHRVVRVLDARAVDEWSTLEVRWTPWSERRPEMRARVVGPEGVGPEVAVRRLQATDLVESAAIEPAAVGEGDETVAADASPGSVRRLRAALQGVEPGAVIEHHVVIREHTPSWPVGVFDRHYLVSVVPVRHARLVLDVPLRLPLRYGARRLPGVEPTKTRYETADGAERLRLELEARDLEPVPATVMAANVGAPSHRPLYPHVAFSTGWSWRRIAAWLDQAVDRASAGARLPGIPTGATSNDARANARAIVAAVREAVRFDGLDLLATPLLIESPDAILARGSGDSLDLAVVTVAALRRAGLDARVALVQPGPGRDVEPRLPGLGGFRHAIVRVVGEQGIEWIDPSHRFTAVGSLPLRAQGRWVLVSTPDGAGDLELERTPASAPEDNLALEQRLVEMVDYGPARIVETSLYRGSAARIQRGVTVALEPEARRRGYRAFAREFHRAADVGRLEESAPLELDRPFSLRLEILEAESARTEIERAVVEVPIAELAGRLPPLFFAPLPGPRREEYEFHDPFVTRWVYRVVPPPGFRPSLPPEPTEETPLGPGRFRRELTIDGTGALVAELELDVGQRLLTAAQLESMHADVQRFLARPPLRLELVAAALDESTEPDDPAEAIVALLEAVRTAPDRAVRRVRLASALLRLGLVDEARRQAELAVELAPSWGPAHAILGRAAFRGVAGVPGGPGADLDTAHAALDEAQRLDPTDEAVRLELADALLVAAGPIDADAPDGLAIRALDVLRAVRRNLGSEAAAVEEARLLLRLERDEEAADVASVTSRPALELAARAAGGSSVDGEVADTVRREAVVELLHARRYRPAATLLRSFDAELSSVLTTVERHERLEGLADDPSTPVRGLLVDLARGGAERAELARWLHPRLLSQTTAGLDDGSFERLSEAVGELVDEAVAPWRRIGAEPPPAVQADLALARFEAALAGAPHLGYRVTLGPHHLYLAVLGGVPKVVTTGAVASELGVEALDRLNQGDVPAARRWLDWAYEEPKGREALAPFWPPPLKGEPSTDALRVAAAALAASRDRSGEAVAILRQAVAVAEDEAEAGTGAAAAEAPGADLRRALETAAERASRTLDHGLVDAADDPAARALRQLLVEPAGAAGPSLDEPARRAELATRVDEALRVRDGRRSPELLRAAAAVLAEAREPYRARALLADAVRRSDRSAPTEGDHFALGKIAEAVGLRLLAVAAYRQIPAPPASSDPRDASWRSLAAKSLAE